MLSVIPIAEALGLVLEKFGSEPGRIESVSLQQALGLLQPSQQLAFANGRDAVMRFQLLQDLGRDLGVEGVGVDVEEHGPCPTPGPLGSQASRHIRCVRCGRMCVMDIREAPR